MMPQALVQTVIPIFAVILVGYAIGKRQKVEVQPYLGLIVYLAGPCLIFASISRSNLNLTDFTTIAGAALAIIFGMSALAFLILKLTRSSTKGLYLPLVFGNTSYLGYPVALFAFGMDGLSRAVVYDMMNSLVIFSLGIFAIQHRNEIREVFRIPLIYAVVVGLAVNLLHIPVPELVFKPIELIGMITIPLALLVLGYKLTEIKLSAVSTTLLASLFKIGGGLLVALAIVHLLALDGLAKNVILLQAAMPSAVMGMILAAKYDRDASLVASVVFITTVLSVISIPLILAFF
jgi:predicted permease